jgi:hypothetical protein
VIGGLMGWIADQDADHAGVAGKRAHLRIGPTFSQTWYQPAAEGAVRTQSIAAVLEASPHLRFTTEYGLSGTKPEPIGASFSQTIGVNVPISKIGVELVAGLVGQQMVGQAPQVRAIYGGDVIVPVTRHFVIAPGVRTTGGGDTRNISTGLSLQYRF